MLEPIHNSVLMSLGLRLQTQCSQLFLLPMSVKTEEINSAHVKRGPPPPQKKKIKGTSASLSVSMTKETVRPMRQGRLQGWDSALVCHCIFVLHVDLPQKRGMGKGTQEVRGRSKEGQET